MASLLRKFSREADTSFQLSEGEVIHMWINKDVFSRNGDLKPQQTFAEVDNTHLLTFKWPKDVKFTTITHWTMQLTNCSQDRKSEFAKDSAKELGHWKWEMVTSVVQKCFKQFKAHVLEVSFWEVKIGHADMRSAQSLRDNLRTVTEHLAYLFSDTEYLFRDVKVSWDTPMIHVLEAPAPVQESSVVTMEHLMDRNSFAIGGSFSSTSDSLTLNKQAHDEAAVSVKAEENHMLREILKQIETIKESIMRNLEELPELKLSMSHLNVKLENHNSMLSELLREHSQHLPLAGCGDSIQLEPIAEDSEEDSSTDRNERHSRRGDTSANSRRDTHVNPQRRDTHADHRRDARIVQETQPRPEQETLVRQHVYKTNSSRSAQRSSGDHKQESGHHQYKPSSARSDSYHGQESRHGQSKPTPDGSDRDRQHVSGQRGESHGQSGRRISAEDNVTHRGARSGSIKENESHSMKTTHDSDYGQHYNGMPSYSSSSISSSNSSVSNESQTKTFSQTSLNMPSNRPSPSTPQSSWKQASSPNQQSSSSQQSSPKQSSSSSSSKQSSPSREGGDGRSQQKQSSPAPSASARGDDKSEGRKKESFSQRTGAPAADTQSESGSEEMMIMVNSDSEARLVKESVNKAHEPEVPAPPKAKSFDTILCLDISESMKEGNAFNIMKNVVTNFIDGVEDVVTKFGVEENIGLVTFGGRTGRAVVVQNLTNDFNLIRDKIDLLEPGGKSPFVEALLVAMAAFVKKGGIVSISGEWHVKPRVIFISDGYPTESTEDAGVDRPNSIQNVRLAMSRMLMAFKNSDTYNKVHPVYFIPVGQHADMKYMEAMSKICDGVYMKPQDTYDLCNYFRLQETVGKALVCLRRESEKFDDDKMQATLTALAPDLSDSEKKNVLETINKELDNPTRPKKSGHPKPTNFDYVFEDTEKVNEGLRLPLGTRVTRGPDWSWGEQDGGKPGTVFSHHERHSVHWVHWDTGEYNCYPFSSRRGYDIWKADDSPRLKTDDEPLEIGMTVKKGKDWKPIEGQELQGEEKGVIIRKSKYQGKVMVRWSNGVIQVCQWSPAGSQEVEYCRPDEDLMPPTLPSPAQRPSQAAGTKFEGRGVWLWRDEHNFWHPYSQEINQEIERVCKTRAKTCMVERAGKKRRILFTRMVEKDLEIGMEFQVKRKT